MNQIPKLLIGVVLGLALTSLVVRGDVTFFGAAVFLILAPVFFLRPIWFFVFFTVFRPVVDILIRGGQLPGNKLVVLLVVPLLVLCAKDLFFNRTLQQRIGESPSLKKVNFFFLLSFLTYLLGYIYTKDRMITSMDLVRYLSVCVAVNFAVAHYGFSEARKLKFFKIVLLSAWIPFGFGFYQAITGTGAGGAAYGRIFGVFAHPNVYAEYLVLIIYLAYYIFTRSPKYSAGRKVYGLMLFLGFMSLVLTFSRTLWAGFAVSVLLFILLGRKTSKKIGLTMGLLVLVLAFLPFIKSRVDDLNQGHLRRSSWQWRVELWQDSLADLKSHPILGHGLGMFELDKGAMAHNDYIRLAYEAGIFSALVMLVFFYYLFQHSIKLSARAPDDQQESYAIAACLVVAIFIGSLGVNTLRNTIIMFYYQTVILVLMQNQIRNQPRFR